MIRTRCWPSCHHSTGSNPSRRYLEPRVVDTRRPILAISRRMESLSRSARVSAGEFAADCTVRGRAGALRAPRVAVSSVTAAYKSLDLPGFAHHVIAMRGRGIRDSVRSRDSLRVDSVARHWRSSPDRSRQRGSHIRVRDSHRRRSRDKAFAAPSSIERHRSAVAACAFHPGAFDRLSATAL